jgi:sugar phosphate isomerase/epimerase
MTNHQTRRAFLRAGSALGLCATTGLAEPAAPQRAIERVGGPALKISLNAYSFSKLLNDFNKQRGPGISLVQLLDFCAKHNFDAIDPTGYFFPGYPEVPSDEYVNNLKRRAFELGLGISGTGVRNNFTTSDKAVRDAGVKHIKQWVEVAARLGAPVLRVFADTQRKNMTWHDVAKDCTRDQVQQWITDDLSECAAYGKEFGVIIGVQNHGDFLQTGEQLLALINAVNSPWCGAIVDTGYFKTKDPYQDMAQVAPYAVNWQIKQNPFGQESETPTDLGKLIRIIRASNYRGYLPIETLSRAGKAYDPFTVVPAFQKELQAAIRIA